MPTTETSDGTLTLRLDGSRQVFVAAENFQEVSLVRHPRKDDPVHVLPDHVQNEPRFQGGVVSSDPHFELVPALDYAFLNIADDTGERRVCYSRYEKPDCMVALQPQTLHEEIGGKFSRLIACSTPALFTRDKGLNNRYHDTG